MLRLNGQSIPWKKRERPCGPVCNTTSETLHQWYIDFNGRHGQAWLLSAYLVILLEALTGAITALPTSSGKLKGLSSTSRSPGYARTFLHFTIPSLVCVTFGGSPSWSNVTAAVAANPEVEWQIVVNPYSGPGPYPPDPNYITGLSKLNSYRNVITLGYVATNYTRTPYSTLSSQIDVYTSWVEYSPANISVGGIFFDEVSNTAADDVFAYYKKAADYAHAHVPSEVTPVIFNPGAPTPAQLFDYADTIVQYENTFSSYRDVATIATFQPGFNDQTAVIVYNTPSTADVKSLVRSMVQQGIQAVYFGADCCYHVFNKQLLNSYRGQDPVPSMKTPKAIVDEDVTPEVFSCVRDGAITKSSTPKKGRYTRTGINPKDVVNRQIDVDTQGLPVPSKDRNMEGIETESAPRSQRSEKEAAAEPRSANIEDEADKSDDEFLYNHEFSDEDQFWPLEHQQDDRVAGHSCLKRNAKASAPTTPQSPNFPQHITWLRGSYMSYTRTKFAKKTTGMTTDDMHEYEQDWAEDGTITITVKMKVEHDFEVYVTKMKLNRRIPNR
ncbi:MAG: hypothetical protein Q9218_006238 [Villophora microphyllina]